MHQQFIFLLKHFKYILRNYKLDRLLFFSLLAFMTFSWWIVFKALGSYNMHPIQSNEFTFTHEGITKAHMISKEIDERFPSPKTFEFYDVFFDDAVNFSSSTSDSPLFEKYRRYIQSFFPEGYKLQVNFYPTETDFRAHTLVSKSGSRTSKDVLKMNPIDRVYQIVSKIGEGALHFSYVKKMLGLALRFDQDFKDMESSKKDTSDDFHGSLFSSENQRAPPPPTYPYEFSSKTYSPSILFINIFMYFTTMVILPAFLSEQMFAKDQTDNLLRLLRIHHIGIFGYMISYIILGVILSFPGSIVFIVLFINQFIKNDFSLGVFCILYFTIALPAVIISLALKFIIASFFRKFVTDILFIIYLIVNLHFVFLIDHSNVFLFNRLLAMFFPLYSPTFYLKLFNVSGAYFADKPLHTIFQNLYYCTPLIFSYIQIIFMVLFTHYIREIYQLNGYKIKRSLLFPLAPFFPKLFSSSGSPSKYTSALVASPEVDPEHPNKASFTQQAQLALDPNAPSQYPLVVQNVCFDYPDGKVVLRNLSFVGGNGVISLLGPNGCGKSTFINILAGLHKQTSGNIYINKSSNFDTDSVTKKDLRVGYCMQDDYFFDMLTLIENVQFFCILNEPGLSSKRALEKSHAILAKVELTEKADSYVSQVSGGEKRRLSIAIAISSPSNILLLDEPTTGLDPKVIHFLWDIIREIKKDRLIFLVTHSMDEAENLGDKIAILSKGTLQCFGTMSELKDEFNRNLRIHFLLSSFSSRGTSMESFIKSMQDLLGEFGKFTENTLNTAWFDYIGPNSKLPYIYDLINSSRSKLGIDDWGFYGYSLKDLFLRIVSEEDANATAT